MEMEYTGLLLGHWIAWSMVQHGLADFRVLTLNGMRLIIRPGSFW